MVNGTLRLKKPKGFPLLFMIPLAHLFMPGDLEGSIPGGNFYNFFIAQDNLDSSNTLPIYSK